MLEVQRENNFWNLENVYSTGDSSFTIFYCIKYHIIKIVCYRTRDSGFNSEHPSLFFGENSSCGGGNAANDLPSAVFGSEMNSGAIDQINSGVLEHYGLNGPLEQYPVDDVCSVHSQSKVSVASRGIRSERNSVASK